MSDKKEINALLNKMKLESELLEKIRFTDKSQDLDKIRGEEAIKLKKNQFPPYKNRYPFKLDNKVLEQIGFAVCGFEIYLEITDGPERGVKDYKFLMNRFVLACIVWSQCKNGTLYNTGNGYGFVTDALKACFGNMKDEVE